jgi:hypothetical protein
VAQTFHLLMAVLLGAVLLLVVLLCAALLPVQLPPVLLPPVLLTAVLLQAIQLPAVLLLPGLLDTYTWMEVITSTPGQELALVAPGTQGMVTMLLLPLSVLLFLLLLHWWPMGKPTPDSVASSLFEEMTLLLNVPEAIEALALVLISVMIPTVFEFRECTFTLVACVI